MKAKLIERGAGFPNVNDEVYDAQAETVYRVVSVWNLGGIGTDDVRGNYIYADVEESDRDVTDYSDQEFGSLWQGLVVFDGDDEAGEGR